MTDEELIYQHPDAIKLVKRLENIWDSRENRERREFIKRELDVDEEIPALAYYCKKCKKDYTTNKAFKVNEIDWNTDSFFRYWKTKHSCGTWNKRYITQKHRDPFFRLSKTIKRERARYYKDIIQPQETGFSMLYGEK